MEQGLFDFMADDPDWEWVLIDSTLVRAHAGASGASKKRVVSAGSQSGGD